MTLWLMYVPFSPAALRAGVIETEGVMLVASGLAELR